VNTKVAYVVGFIMTFL